MPQSGLVRALAGAGIVAALLASEAVSAHGLGASQLRLRVDGPLVEGAWEVQVADAARAVGLPRADEEALRAREADLGAFLAARLSFAGDGVPCAPIAPLGPVEWQRQLGQVRFGFRATCLASPRRVTITCGLLFDADPRHRVYFSVEDARETQVGVLRAERRAVTLDVRQLRPGADFAEFAREGVRHIWTGLDHLLFLLALLLPAPLVREASGWGPRAGLAATAREVLKVVTAFTLAHSLTLALAAFDLVSPRPRFVEVAIAVSVLAAAWNNLRPFLPGRASAMAFAFGLVHGLGFAAGLRDLALPLRARGLAVFGFNVGVELGQLAVVAPLLPLLYAASRRRAYARFGLGAGSLAIAWIAALWILERAFGLSVLTRS
jgi:hypothetical protein